MAKKPPAGAAYAPPPYELADVGAIQALAKGQASEYQQVRALKWIVDVACATYDQSYRPGGEDGRRDSDFAEGRRFVGNQIVKLTKINPELLRKKDARGRSDTGTEQPSD